MKVLVVNAGSSSLKYQLIDMTNEKAIVKGLVERVGQPMSNIIYEYNQAKHSHQEPIKDHIAAVKIVLDSLVSKDAPLNSIDEISAVGHRVVHSGEKFVTSVKIDSNVIKDIEKISELAPLHNPANLAGIRACLNILPNKPSVAVFDTSFHSSMPNYAYMYALPYNLYTDHQIRKYGFHGTSHKYVSDEVAKLIGKKDSKIIVCHLGNGASVSAVDSGKCIDTSMGFTPLEGLIMGTRCGDIDPSVVEYITAKTGQTLAETINMFNKKSGVLGVSGVSSDFRDVMKAKVEGNDRAGLAMDMFCYRVKKYIGSYAAALGGLDAIAFTAGVGENSSCIREQVCLGLEFLGIKIDNAKNKNAKSVVNTEITVDGSKVKVYVIPTNEELVIARETIKYGF